MSDKKFMNIKYFDKIDESRINPIIRKLHLNLVMFPNNFPKEDIINNEKNLVNWTLCENKSHQVKDDKLLIGDSEKLFLEGKSSRKDKNSSEYE